MRLDLNQIKVELNNVGTKKVDRAAFEEDMQSLQEFYEDNQDIAEFSKKYISSSFGYPVDLKLEDNYITLIK